MKAFPTRNVGEGMDLRDYFAAKAMEIAVKQLERNYTIELGGIEGPDNTWVWEDSDMEEIAEWAYFLADEMMKARKNS